MITRTWIRTALIATAILALSSSCKDRSDTKADKTASADRPSINMPSGPPAPPAPEQPAPAMEEEPQGFGFAADDKMALKADLKSEKGRSRAKRRSKKRKPKDAKPGRASGGLFDDEGDNDDGVGGGGGERGPQTRAWFPETFLFEPLLVTDDAGQASLDVRVPDRLTTWRVLALAHSREGGQAGTTTSFLGTLPAYVDPVLPSLLRSGDRVRLPIQLVNTTPTPLPSTLTIEAANATVAGAGGAVTIPAQSNIVQYTTFGVNAPGEARLLARLGDTDVVIRTTDVIPTGRPVEHTQSGTLAAPRQYAIASPAQANPALSTARLQVFPGALSILRSELSASIYRGGVADDAFALLLAGNAPALLRALGDEPDPEALRKLAILATQRVIRHARTLDTARASLLADAAFAHPENPVLDRLGKRAVEYLERHQVPDGTCGGNTGWTLQRLLVATAHCARAAKDAPKVGIRASGAFERHAKLIEDPYTAAAILASGSASSHLIDKLRKIVVDAIEDRPDGSKIVKVPGGVVRPDGVRPSTVEATALAVLALEGDAKAPLADLGAAVLSGYSPVYGWGDGRANLVCMQAVLRLFKDPIPDNVNIVLSMDGKPVAEGALTRDKVREVLTLEAAGLGAAGAHDWQVRAEPAVPGLGFSLQLTHYVPWEQKSVNKGLELSVTAPEGASVGKPADVAVQAIAPSGRSLSITLTWPAGVQVDTAALDKLVEQNSIARYNTADGKLELFVNPLAPAQVFSANVRVIPTLAGSLHSGPSSIKLGATTIHQPPAVWTVTP